jgi:glucose-6-phosphate dehydrogenase assembly protein OpcA
VPAALSADGILSELQEFWASLGGQSTASESHALLRACAMTLIVIAEEAEDPAAIAQTIGEVMHDHPNRAIVVRLHPGTGTLLDHRITAHCWMPFGTRRQICCEQVEITASNASLPGLLPVLTAIAAPDLPVVVWCRGARISRLPAVTALAHMSDKLIVDSAGFADARAALEDFAADAGRGRPLADLSWTRITRWREIVAHVFDHPGRRELIPRLRQVKVFHAGDPPPASAYYLAGWVLASIGRQDIEARFEAVAGAGIEGIALDFDSHLVSIRRAQGDAVRIAMDSLISCTVAPRLTEAELLGNELAISGKDAVFQQSLETAARLARR